MNLDSQVPLVRQAREVKQGNQDRLVQLVQQDLSDHRDPAGYGVKLARVENPEHLERQVPH